jgi:D-glycero-alpha-D-manno-heptose 1-phosphate guanylyltransferase
MKLTDVIILAGGKGTRLKSVLENTPKCLAPINGHPFLFYILNYLNKNGIKNFIFSLGYMSQDVINYLKKSHSDLNYSTVVESEPLLTGGAVKYALNLCSSDDVLIINADTFFEIDIQSLYTSHILNKSDCTIALKAMKNFERYGAVDLNSDNRILSFQEKKYYQYGLINGGIYILNILNFKKHWFDQSFSFEKAYLEMYIKKDKIYGFVFDQYFIDIGVPEDYTKAQIDIK